MKIGSFLLSSMSAHSLLMDFVTSTNAHNDVLLHQLVHTKLLSGSLNSEQVMSSTHRRKALAGRVLELSGATKLGKGEQVVREKERNKATKRVREGIMEKEKKREKQQLEEVTSS
jgi:hypothetical protein